MGCFIAKLKGEDNRWYKLADQENNEDYESIDLAEAIEYDPNNTEAGQWFYVPDFNNKDGFLPLLDLDFDVVDLDSLSNEQFASHNIDFIAFYDAHRYFIQKFTKGNFLKKKWFAWNGDAVQYFEEDGLIYLNPTPNCIYDNQSHRIYFMDISKAYTLFADLKLDYKEATEAETTQMLQLDIIQTDGFDASGVGVSNRKRITSILAKYNQYEPEKKATLKRYIRDTVGDNLPFDEVTGKFIVNNDSHLRLLLYGIQQRFYQPPLEDEVQVATSTTGISKLI